jgi:hypothetical protein
MESGRENLGEEWGLDPDFHRDGDDEMKINNHSGESRYPEGKGVALKKENNERKTAKRIVAESSNRP